VDCVPKVLSDKAASGEIAAGLLPTVDTFRLASSFERLGHVGIAVRGRARSVLLFSRKPIRQLDGAIIAVTEQSSTSAVLLRLLLEVRYRLAPQAYQRGRHPEADALLLIGDEALRFRQTNMQYPFEIDLGFEWWLWQHAPFVFAIWMVRKDVDAQEKRQIEIALMKALAMNTAQLDAVAQEYASTLGLPVQEVRSYLSGFVYRLSQAEEEGIARFKELLDEHHLL